MTFTRDVTSDKSLVRLNKHLFGVVDTLQVEGRDVGAVEGLSNVLLVAGEDLALHVCTHRIRLITPAGVEKGRDMA